MKSTELYSVDRLVRSKLLFNGANAAGNCCRYWEGSTMSCTSTSRHGQP